MDCHDFLKTLADACESTGFEIHAYCLRRNHFHLVVEMPNGNLVAGMRWLLSAYTLRFNPRHKRFGYKVRIILSSGVTEALTDATVVEFQTNGVIKQITKPYTADILLNMLYEILHPQ